jgi:hypothetical protein
MGWVHLIGKREIYLPTAIKKKERKKENGATKAASAA